MQRAAAIQPPEMVLQEVQRAIKNSHDYLFAQQLTDGSWRDYVASSALATSYALSALYYADAQRFAPLLKRGCIWLRTTQQASGGWGDAVTDVGTFNSTAVTLATLHMIEPEASAEQVQRGLAYLETLGGLGDLTDPQKTVTCQGYLALAGLSSWERSRRIPLALIALPKRMWMRFSITMPAIFGWALVHQQKLPGGLLLRSVNGLMRPKVLRWIEQVRGCNGSWQDSPLLTGLVSLCLLVAGVPYEQVAPGLAYVVATQRADGSWAGEEDLSFSVTTFLLDGLQTVMPLDGPRFTSTRDWILAAQRDEHFMATGCPGGWWSWRQPCGWPDTDDTCGAIIALRQLGVAPDHPQIRRGCAWLCQMQNRDGSWGMFVKNCHAPMDEPCPALTSRVVLALHACLQASEGPRYRRAIERALGYLQWAQRPDGTFESIWYQTQVYGTAQALEVLVRLGWADTSQATRCRAALLAQQRADGSWGHLPEAGGTVEETAWALSALALAPEDVPAEALDRAAHWLVHQQQEAGCWPPSVIGYYARALSYSSDHLANGFALRALGLYAQVRQGQAAENIHQ